MVPGRAAALTTVSVLLLPVVASGQWAQWESTPEQRALLEFNHHAGGVIVLILAGLTWLEVLGTRLIAGVRLLWPSCLILIGLYNFIFSDLLAWPIGPKSLTDTLSNPMVLQHKALALIVLALGLIDLLQRLGRLTPMVGQYLFSALALLAGGLLVLHDPVMAAHQHSPRLFFSHVLMGLLAILALAFKVLVDNQILTGRFAQLYPLVLTVLGLQLLLYSDG